MSRMSNWSMEWKSILDGKSHLYTEVSWRVIQTSTIARWHNLNKIINENHKLNKITYENDKIAKFKLNGGWLPSSSSSSSKGFKPN